jgi:aspartyl-tRNA(Asn)/glutamyl-tRNA(Gln) amidotransferase subunit C
MDDETKITTEEIRHLALLTRINMTEEEVDIMRGQMSDILNSIQVLNQVDTEGVEPTAHSSGVDSVLREDESRPSIPIEDALSNAPNVQDGFIRVRAVFE